MHNLPGDIAAQALETEGAERERAIKSAYEPAAQRKLVAYARKRCRMLERSDDRSACAQPEDLVQDAIVDTWLGEVSWSPPCPIITHLMGVIRGRTARQFERHVARPHTSVDRSRAGDDAADLGGPVALGPDVDICRTELLNEALRFVRANAGADSGIDALLFHYLRGAGDRADAMADGMPERSYDSARKRLDRILARAPSELRDVLTSWCWREG